jgi:aspartyl-tRNA synthetase
MVLLNVESIREVIAFPKTQTGVDPLFDAPDAVDDDQLRDLRIMLTE